MKQVKDFLDPSMFYIMTNSIFRCKPLKEYDSFDNFQKVKNLNMHHLLFNNTYVVTITSLQELPAIVVRIVWLLTPLTIV